LQQIVSFLLPAQPQAQQPGAAAGGGQTGPEGLFRGLLAAMMTGAAAPTIGEAASLPVSQPVEKASDGDGQSAHAQAAPTQGVPPASLGQALASVAVQAVLPPAETGGHPEETGEPLAATAMTPDAQVQAALVAGALPATAAPAPPQAPPAESPETASVAPVAAEPPPAPALEAFAQKVVQMAQEGMGPVAPASPLPPTEKSTDEPQAASKTSFGDLVDLVVQAEGGRQTETSSGDTAERNPQPVTPSQNRTATASHAEPMSASAMAEAPEAMEASGSEAPAAEQAPATTPTRQPEQVTEAPPAETAPKAPPEPDAVVRQVSRFIKVTLEGERSEVRLQLHPENLGTVAVRLVVAEGTVRVQIMAGDPSVKAVLEANIEQLRTRLTEQGLQVEQVHVTAGGGNWFTGAGQSGQGEQHRHQPQRFHPAPWERNVPEHPEAQTPDPRPASRSWTPGATGMRIDHLA